MNTMMEISTHDALLHNSNSPISNRGVTYNVKRIGAKPICFEGTELAMAMSYTPSVHFWYEINLYHTSEDRFVSAIRVFHQSEDKRDTVQAWETTSLDDAIDKLTEYDAACDVEMPGEDHFGKTTPAESASIALQMMARMNAARHHYKSLVGELLFDLESGQ